MGGVFRIMTQLLVGSLEILSSFLRRCFDEVLFIFFFCGMAPMTLDDSKTGGGLDAFGGGEIFLSTTFASTCKSELG